MWTWLGWLALIIAAGLGYRFLQLREQSGPARRPEEAAERKRPLIGAGVAAVLGVLLLAVGSQARPTLKLTHAYDFSRDPEWLIAGGENVRWDQDSGRLYTKLEVGSGRYAAIPVDWDGDAFRAEWDITITALPQKPMGALEAESVIAVGLTDGSVSNIEDTDHVGGSTIQATFTPDGIHLRTSDTNLIERSAPDPGNPGSEGETTKPEIGKTYHCVLGYQDTTDTATLRVFEAGSTTPVADLRVTDLADFSPNMSYFAVTVKGYNRFKAEKLTAECYIDDVKFYQP